MASSLDSDWTPLTNASTKSSITNIVNSIITLYYSVRKIINQIKFEATGVLNGVCTSIRVKPQSATGSSVAAPAVIPGAIYPFLLASNSEMFQNAIVLNW